MLAGGCGETWGEPEQVGPLITVTLVTLSKTIHTSPQPNVFEVMRGNPRTLEPCGKFQYNKMGGMSMRHLYMTILMVLLLFGLLVSVALAKSGADTVLALYTESYTNPESFGSSDILQRARGERATRQCLGMLNTRLREVASARMDVCGRMPAGFQCLNQDPNASLGVWANNMTFVVNNQVTWSDTYIGTTLTFAKRMMESLAPGLWGTATRASVPFVRQIVDQAC